MNPTLLLALVLAAVSFDEVNGVEKGRGPLHAPPRAPHERLEQSLLHDRPLTLGARPEVLDDSDRLPSPRAAGFQPPQLFALEPPPAFSGAVRLDLQEAAPPALPPYPGAAPTGGLSLERVMRLYRSSGPRTGLQLTVVPGPPCWP